MKRNDRTPAMQSPTAYAEFAVTGASLLCGIMISAATGTAAPAALSLLPGAIVVARRLLRTASIMRACAAGR